MLLRLAELGLSSGGFREGRGGGCPPSGIQPPADSKDSTFGTIFMLQFWLTDLQIFLKHYALLYIEFIGRARQKSSNFLVQKVLTKIFLWPVVSKKLYSDVREPRKSSISRVDLGGGNRRPPPLLKDLTPYQPKGSHLCTILTYPYLATDPKIFLKAPLAPIYTNFEGGGGGGIGAPAKKLGAENLTETGGLFSDLGELKKVEKIFKFFFEKSAPPLEKILDPPLSISSSKS